MQYKILYKAVNAEGQPKAGYVDADSAEEAINKLKAQGFSDIRLMEDPALAIERDYLEGLSEEEIQSLAEFEAQTHNKLQSKAGFLLEVGRQNKTAAIVILGLLAVGIYIDSWFMVIACLAVTGFIIYTALSEFQVAERYELCNRCYALGDWDGLQKHSEWLRKNSDLDDLLIDLDFKQASVYAMQGDLDKAKRLIQPHQHSMNAAAPGSYEGRAAGLYYYSHDYPGFVSAMREAYEKMPDSPSAMVDVALAEARFGSVVLAEEVMTQVKPELLPVFALPFIDFVNGIIAYKKNDPGARRHLQQALDAMSSYEDNPVMWGTLALCSAWYALVLYDEGALAEADGIMSSVASIIAVHGDKPLQHLIAQRRQENT